MFEGKEIVKISCEIIGYLHGESLFNNPADTLENKIIFFQQGYCGYEKACYLCTPNQRKIWLRSNEEKVLSGD